MTDTRTLVVSMIGTGIAVITVVVAFMAILASGINTRIDDLNATVNARIDDVNTRIGNVETDLARAARTGDRSDQGRRAAKRLKAERTTI